MACLQAVERGEFDLDCDLAKCVASGPEAGPASAPGAAAAIAAARNPLFPNAPLTPRHLLTHTAGLCDSEDALLEGPYRVSGTDFPHSLHAYVARRLVPGGGDFNPGIWGDSPPGRARSHYSNAGFTLLAAALELATGRSLQQLAEDHIFGPLGMTRSSFSLATAMSHAESNLASPHRAWDAQPHYGVAEWPAAQLRSTANDLGRYLCALTTPGHPVMKPASVEAMLPASGRSGLAWWGLDSGFSCGEAGLWEHGGFMDGARTHIWLWPESSCGAVLLTNGDGCYADVTAEIKAAVRLAS